MAASTHQTGVLEIVHDIGADRFDIDPRCRQPETTRVDAESEVPLPRRLEPPHQTRAHEHPTVLEVGHRIIAAIVEQLEVVPGLVVAPQVVEQHELVDESRAGSGFSP